MLRVYADLKPRSTEDTEKWATICIRLSARLTFPTDLKKLRALRVLRGSDNSDPRKPVTFAKSVVYKIETLKAYEDK